MGVGDSKGGSMGKRTLCATVAASLRAASAKPAPGAACTLVPAGTTARRGIHASLA